MDLQNAQKNDYINEKLFMKKIYIKPPGWILLSFGPPPFVMTVTMSKGI